MKISTRVWKALRWLLLIGLALFAIAQVVRPAKRNPTSEASLALESQVQVEPEVAAIFERSCNDCHSNKTRWPWYSQVAPVSWWVIEHVNRGRSQLNFSEWGKYETNEKRNLLKQACGLSKQGAMPLGSYTPMHPGSKLSPADVETICEWSTQVMMTLR